MPIRKVSIALGRLTEKQGIQLNLFETFTQKKEEEKLAQTLDEVHIKFGKNSLLSASSLLKHSTIKDRNEKIGGHHE